MVKNDVFSMVGGLGGDFYKDIYEPKLFGMHSVRMQICEYRFYLDGERVRTQGQKGRFFDVWRGLL